MDKQLLLLRHGRTGYSGRYIGSTDVGLSEEGSEQILDVRSRLFGFGISKIFCSPMLRCRQSSEILDLGIEIEIVDHLKEIDFGRWEKKSFKEIVSDDPALVDEWVANPFDFTFPDGESTRDFVSRVKGVQQSIANSSPNKILIVSHGGVIRILICLFLSLQLENYLLFKVEKGKYTILELFGEGGVLTGFNCN